MFARPIRKSRFFNLKKCTEMNKTTTKVKLLLQTFTYEEMAEKIGISRTTLYKRLQCNDWKVSEIHLITTM